MPMKWTQVPAALLQEPELVAADFFAVVNGVTPVAVDVDGSRYEKWGPEFGVE